MAEVFDKINKIWNFHLDKLSKSPFCNFVCIGNLCRCTGYRPIIEAFYSFTQSSSETMKCSSCFHSCLDSDLCNVGTAVVEGVNSGAKANRRLVKNKLTDSSQLQNFSYGISSKQNYPTELRVYRLYKYIAYKRQ